MWIDEYYLHFCDASSALLENFETSMGGLDLFRKEPIKIISSNHHYGDWCYVKGLCTIDGEYYRNNKEKCLNCLEEIFYGYYPSRIVLIPKKSIICADIISVTGTYQCGDTMAECVIQPKYGLNMLTVDNCMAFTFNAFERNIKSLGL